MAQTGYENMESNISAVYQNNKSNYDQAESPTAIAGIEKTKTKRFQFIKKKSTNIFE